MASLIILLCSSIVYIVIDYIVLGLSRSDFISVTNEWGIIHFNLSNPTNLSYPNEHGIRQVTLNNIYSLERESRIILLEQEVPHVEVSVHARGQEDPGSRGTPHAVGEGTRVVRRPHNGAVLDVLTPDSSSPVSRTQEELGIERVASEGVNRSMVSRECDCYLIGGIFGFAIATIGV